MNYIFCVNLWAYVLIGADAAAQIKENASDLGVPVVARHGRVFESWLGESFDYIVDYISGIAQDVAKVSPWFRKMSCESGKDGSDLEIEAINSVASHLKRKSIVFPPIFSLSNTEKLSMLPMKILEMYNKLVTNSGSYQMN